MKEIKLFKRLYLILAWFDVWVGLYYNQQKKKLYIMVPFIGIFIDLKTKRNESQQKTFNQSVRKHIS